MKKIALVSSKQYNGKVDDDRLLLACLQKQGFDVKLVSWDDPEVIWDNFDCLILRSCWNYIYHAEEFFSWVLELEKKHIAMWNRSDVIRWNYHKKYLLDLAQKGITIIPTYIVIKQADIIQMANENNWVDIVLKPTIGNASYQVQHMSLIDIQKKEKEINHALGKQEMLIQPFIKEIQEEGEWSFVFLGGKFSHAVLKRPKKGDFRAHPDFGAQENMVSPDTKLTYQAQSVYDAIGKKLLYARVDGIVHEGKFFLMELELIEPYLFFSMYPSACDVFVKAIKKLL